MHAARLAAVIFGAAAAASLPAVPAAHLPGIAVAAASVAATVAQCANSNQPPVSNAEPVMAEARKSANTPAAGTGGNNIGTEATRMNPCMPACDTSSMCLNGMCIPLSGLGKPPVDASSNEGGPGPRPNPDGQTTGSSFNSAQGKFSSLFSIGNLNRIAATAAIAAVLAVSI